MSASRRGQHRAGRKKLAVDQVGPMVDRLDALTMGAN